MGFRNDQQAQAAIVGAVLLLGIFTISISIYQTTVVPGENTEIEFKAYEQALSDLENLRSGYLEAASTGNMYVRNVKTGANYPTRVLFVNPPDPEGHIATTDRGTVTLNNFSASKKFKDYWDGSEKTFSTRSVEFHPDYNELSIPTTTLEPWGPLYQNASGSYVFHSGQFLVNDTTLQLLLIDRSVDEWGYSSEVGIQGFTPYRVVTIQNNTVRPSIEIPSSLPVDEWRNDEELLRDELASGNVYAVESAGPGRVRVVLKKGTTYTLKVAGQSLPDSLIENSETVEEAMGGGVGVAGISDFEFDITETISTQGGLWVNIDDLESINISDPQFVPLTGDSFQKKEDDRYFRLVFSIENSTTRFTFVLPSADSGIYYTLPDSTTFSNRGVTVYKYVEGSGTSAELFIGSPTTRLENSVLDSWYNDGTSIDLLNSLNYDSDIQSELNEIQALTNGNETAEIFIGHMHGRIFMEIGTAGGAGNQAPTAAFTYSPASPSTGETITFDASSSADTDGTITSYEWDWTNDGTYDATGVTTTHSYGSASTYTVKLRVTDNDGATNTTTDTVTVSSTTTTTYLDCPTTDTFGTTTNCANAQSASDGGAVASLTEEDTQNGPNVKYELNVEAAFSGVPSGTNELQVRYRIPVGDETINLQVWNSASSSYVTQGTLSSTTFANFTYILNADEYNGGSPQIRFVDTAPTDGTQTTVEVDYARIVTN